MQRFLVRNQAPKPDPGIVNRAAKAKKHRKIEKIVEATLYKRRKLETRSAFLHEHEIQEPTIGHNKHVGMAGHAHIIPKGGQYGAMHSVALSARAAPAIPAANGRPAVPGRQARGEESRPKGNVLRIYPPGEHDYGFMEVAGAVPERLARTVRTPSGRDWEPARPAKAGHVRYFRASGRAGNDAQWDEVAEGEHLRNAEQFNFMEHPHQPLAPGLMAQRLRAIERK